MTNYDYIILGAGASGLMLAYRMANDAFFDDKSILIIDRTTHKGNDRTWCFWEENNGEWDSILTKQWQTIFFGSKTFSKSITISPYSYKMLRSSNFYKFLRNRIYTKPNISFLSRTVSSFKETIDGVEVIVQERENEIGEVLNQFTYTAKLLFTSLDTFEAYNFQDKYPVLQQHFLGWFIKTKAPVFDDSKATFMDFDLPQNGNTRFMYVLPLNTTSALFEYTLFSKNVLEKSDYENAIASYLKDKGILDYEIIEKELGSIPMTAFNFQNLNSKRILNIGTAGGWTKASTGYTFKATEKRTKQLAEFLKLNNDLSLFKSQPKKYRFYDTIFLDVLANNNEKGTALFTSLFRRCNINTIFRFLDEESSFTDDLKIILSVKPKADFIKAFFKRLLSS